MEALNKERNEKESELSRLLALTPKDIWRIDLQQFMVELDVRMLTF